MVWALIGDDSEPRLTTISDVASGFSCLSGSGYLLRSRSAVDLVGVQLVGGATRAFPSPDAQGRDRIQLRSHQRAVVAGGTGQNEAERRAARVGDEVALGARLARSVGFGPVADPLFSPARSRCRRSPGSSRSRPPHAGTQAVPYAGAATRRPPANRAAGANSSCRSRTSSRLAASPRECPSAARTGCRSGRHGRPPGDARPSGERRVRPQKRGDRSPEIVGKKRASHNNPTPNQPDRAALLGVLRP